MGTFLDVLTQISPLGPYMLQGKVAKRNKAGGAVQSYLAVRVKCDGAPICMLARPVVTTMAMVATWQWRHYLLPCPVYIVAIWTLDTPNNTNTTQSMENQILATFRLNN